MNPFMIIFFMLYNFIMPKFFYIYALLYFFYAYTRDYLLFEVNTWLGLGISFIFAITLHFLISENVFKITYKRYMEKVSDIEPFVAKTLSMFVLNIFSIFFSITILDYIISLKLFG